MSQKEDARAALRGRVLANRAVAVALVLLVLLTVFLWFRATRPRQHALRMTAGDPLSHRHKMAEILCDEARRRGLVIDLVSTAGSQQSLEKVAAGELDVAIALGDLDFPDDVIRQVAVLYSEPMHLFVRPELMGGGLAGLRGKRLSLGVRGSSTHKVAHRMFSGVGVEPGEDFEEVDYSYEQLRDLPSGELPDGIFALTALPWTEVGEMLVKKHGYLLMELPFGEAMSLRDPSLHDMVIPAYSYGVNPPVPERPIHTVAEKLLIVAHQDTSEAAVEQLMKVVFETDFARRARIASLDPTAVDTARQFPLHPGTIKYLHRNQPLVTIDFIEKLENLRSFLVSAVLAVFLFWRWQKRRRMIGFEAYIDAATEVELEALAMERKERFDLADLRRLQRRLSEIKGEALERQAEGVLTGEDQMASFLTHISDVRSYLESLYVRASQPAPAPEARAQDQPAPPENELV